MMPLSSIRAFDRTLSPDGHSAVADLLAAPWSPDPGSVRFFRTSANVIFTIRRNGERSFLRASAATERTRRTIEGELHLIDLLAARRVPVVSTIPSNDGERIVSIDTPLGGFHVVLFAALPGTIRDVDDLSIEDYRRWGAAIGRIHAVLADVSQDVIARPPSWLTALDTIETHHVVPDATRKKALQLRQSLERLPRTRAWYGPLHGDLEPDNLTWDGETVWALDFDAASCGWYLLDLAKALSDPFDAGLTLEDAQISGFLTGYREHHPLSDNAISHLPEFQLLSRAIDYASLLHAVDLTEAEADADWVRTLLGRLATRMRETESLLAR